ncbi:MAG: NADH-quinone oxidoreductase subunit C [Bryobacterales bacterium]|nr:NADH-quinone oxidoreductase subunit C [Bryobacterales bacterium]
MLTEELQRIPHVQAIAAMPGALQTATVHVGEVTLTIDPEHIVAVCRKLRDEFGAERLSGITGLDWYPMEPRFEVVYLIHSIRNRYRLKLKCRLPGGDPGIESVYEVWRAADWYEREVFDLFGVTFRNHPNLKRILMPDDWQGHPLRKDFPVHGHKYSYRAE